MRDVAIQDVTEHDDNCVRQVPIFSGLTADQQDIVATMARPELLSAGEYVHQAGERTGKMFVVHTGQIQLSRTLPTGSKYLLRVAQPGETLGEHAYLTGGTALDEAQAMSDVRLCVFVHDDLTKLLQQYPQIAQRMLTSLGDRLAHTEHRLTLSSQSVDVRIADFLLQQPLMRQEQSTTGGMQVRLPLSKKDIAALLGVERPGVCRWARRVW